MNRFFILLLLIFGINSFAKAQAWEDSLSKGKTLYAQGAFKKAYQTLVNAQKIAPENVNLSQDIGNAAYKAKDYKTAENAYQIAANNTQKNTLKNAKFWHNIGNSQLMEKDYQAAIDSYKKALRQDPNDQQTRYNLAVAQQKLRKQQQNNKSQNKAQNKQKENKNTPNKNNEKKSNNQDNKNKQQNNPAQQNNSGQKSNKKDNKTDQSFSEKENNRVLKSLLKQSMATKEKVSTQQQKQQGNISNSGKRW